jgi:hypothetical protein
MRTIARKTSSRTKVQTALFGVKMINLVIWLVCLIPALAIELVCYLLAPLVALFVTYQERADRVKRYGKVTISMDREYLPTWLRYFQTHDNAVDEWWYGVYNTDHWFAFARNWTQGDYNTKAWVRYYCRLMWLWRNCAYGFHYAWFSRPKEFVCKMYVRQVIKDGKRFWYSLAVYKSSFQFECHIPLGWRYISINIGWKAHKQMPKLLYANRLISFRKVAK